MSKTTYIAGRHAVFHALSAGRRHVHEIYCVEGHDEKASKTLWNLAKDSGVPIVPVERSFFRKKIPVETHQGIAGLVDELPLMTLPDFLVSENESSMSRILVLDGIEDPHNLGALLRTASCFGVSGVIWSKQRAAPLSPVAVKAAAGAVEYLRLVRVSNIVLSLQTLKKAGYWIYGSMPTAHKSLWDEAFSPRAVLVIGGEGKGMHRLVSETCDILLRIPTSGPIESLNAAVAGGILLSRFAI